MITYFPPCENPEDFVGNEKILNHVLSAIVRYELNGPYDLTMTMTTKDYKFSGIKENSVIKCLPGTGEPYQYFRVSIITPNQYTTEIVANHISYDMTKKVIDRIEKYSGLLSDFVNSINDRMLTPYRFRIHVGTAGDEHVYINRDSPSSLKSIIGGSDDSIIDQLHYIALYDNYDVWIRSNVPEDSMTVTKAVYGINITDDTNMKIDTQNLFTHIVPYYQTIEGTLVLLDERIVASPYSTEGDVIFAKPVDLTGKFPDTPTQEELRAEAIKWFDVYKDDMLREINIALIPVDQNKLPINIFVNDTVYVTVPFLGLTNYKTRCVSIEYDVLEGLYTDIRIGSVVKEVSSTIAMTVQNVDEMKKGGKWN